MIIREIGASLRALFTRLSAKTTTITGTETVYLDDAGASVKAALSDAIRYGGGNSTRVTTIGNANIHQKNDGTMWLEVTGQTAGNARGAGAFDWQGVRTNASYVAAASNTVCIGGKNNQVNSSEAGCFVGVNNVANGLYSVCLGGAFQTNTNPGQVSFGVGAGQARGMGNLIAFYHSTSDATLTVLSLTGTAGILFVVPAGKSVAFTGIVQAMCNVSSTSNFIKAWKIEGVITRDGNNTTRIVGTPTITVMAQDADGTPTPSTWAIASITADDTNDALAINVTGQTGQTIRWQATVMYSQVGF